VGAELVEATVPVIDRTIGPMVAASSRAAMQTAIDRPVWRRRAGRCGREPISPATV